MTKSLAKILLAICLTAQLTFGQILVDLDRKRAVDIPIEKCNKRLVCQSNNDPHMVNFWNQPFEFQFEVKDQCLHQTKYYQVSANFKQCPSPWLSAKCNCAVKITLYNGEQAFIDKCGNSVYTTDMVSFSSSPSVTCQTVTNNLFNPLDESDWALLPVTSGNNFFLCAIVNGHTFIKSRLFSSNENVIVEVYPGMSSLRVHASLSFTASPTPNKRCLCDNKKDMLTEHHIDVVENHPEQIEKCKGIFVNECFRILLQFEDLLSPERIEEIEKLIANCALDLDLSNGEGEVGFFQQNEIQDQIDTAILEAFANPKNQEILAKYCACQQNNDPKHMEICDRLNIKF